MHATESSLMQACCPCLWPGGHSDRWYGMVHMDHGLPDRKSRPRLKDKRWLLLGSNRRFIPIMDDQCYNFRTVHGPTQCPGLAAHTLQEESSHSGCRW